MSIRFTLFILFVSTFFSQDIIIRQLANEGIWIRSESVNIIIDGLFKREYEQFSVLTEDQISLINQGSADFPSADLILASHIHGDHYNKDLVGDYLSIHKQSKFISVNAVFRDLQNHSKFTSFEDRVQAIIPAMNKQFKVTISGIDLVIMRFPHVGSEPLNLTESIVFMVKLNDKKIVHFGDADLRQSSIEPFQEILKNCDLAIMPYWNFIEETNQTLLMDLIKSKRYVLSHIPVNSQDNVKQKFQDDDQITVFTDFQQTIILND
ncbi:MAG: MBL fold metallo-hydrolase [Calditrichaeota bacterium]|nr:MBL fold metallo-hydrolase [Calditrichota bacterium]